MHHSSVSWDTTPLYFSIWNFVYFQQKELIKVQSWWIFTWADKSLKFWTLMGSFCPNDIQFQLKKYRKVIFHYTKYLEQCCKVWINTGLVVSKIAKRIGWTFIRALRSLKHCTLMGSFCPKHIIFQLESFTEIMFLKETLKGNAEFKGKLTCGL